MNNIKFTFVEEKKATSNFSIDMGVKREFKLEVTKNGGTMSDVLETLMKSYIIESKQLHLEYEEKDNETNGQ